MDVFNFLKGHQINIEEVFQQAPSPNLDLERGFKQLQSDMEKQVRLCWDIASFEMYITKNLTPKRLLWDVNHNDGVEDLTLVDEWFQFFSACEQKLMQMMVRRRQAKKLILESKIAELKERIEPFQGTKEFLDKAQQLHTYLFKYDAEIQQKKLKKYHRDTKDFEQNQVYKWQAELTPASSNESSVVRRYTMLSHN